jgi:diaminohydroxyphosphoribosylaminopyrimidine deaminase/5-amino-6-(5-phosphoribosylamino)uracil reductase
VRLWKGSNPLRIVFDQHLCLPGNISLFDKSIPTLVYTSGRRDSAENLDYISIDFDERILDAVMDDLFGRSVQSLIIEGGPKLLNSFIAKGLWDEARVFTGPVKFGDGVKAPGFNFIPIKEIKTGNSKLNVYRNTSDK